MAEESNNDGGGGFADFLKWLPTLWAVNQAAGDPAGLSEPSLTEEQEQLFSKQSEMFDLIMEDMRRRNSLSLRQDPETGELSGPLVETLNTALGNVRQQQAAPRMRVQAQSFNPFGEARDPQMFGADIPVLAPPSDVVAGDGGTGDGDTGGDEDPIVDDEVVEGPGSGTNPLPDDGLIPGGLIPVDDDPLDITDPVVDTVKKIFGFGWDPDETGLAPDKDTDGVKAEIGFGWNPSEVVKDEEGAKTEIGMGWDPKEPEKVKEELRKGWDPSVGVPEVPTFGLGWNPDAPELGGMGWRVPEITTPDLPRIPDLGIPENVDFPSVDFQMPNLDTGLTGLISNGFGDLMDGLGEAIGGVENAARDAYGDRLWGNDEMNVTDPGPLVGSGLGWTPMPGDTVGTSDGGITTVGEDPRIPDDGGGIGLTPEQAAIGVTDRVNTTDQFDQDRVPGAGLSIISAADDLLGLGIKDQLQDWGILPTDDRSVTTDQAWAEYANANGLDRTDAAARAEYDQMWADEQLAQQILGDPQNVVALRQTIENAPNSAIGMIGNEMGLPYAAQFSQWYWGNFDAIKASGFADPVLAQIYSTEGIEGLMNAGLPGPDGVYASTEGGILSGSGSGTQRGSGDVTAPQRTQTDVDEDEFTRSAGGYRA